MKMELNIRPALPGDSGPLSRMLLAQRTEYMRHFSPFAFSEPILKEIFVSAKDDRYWLLLTGGDLAGLFMLRGFDTGYETPSFGVAVSEHYSGLGLSSLALSFAISWCAANRVPAVMLKVHPENAKAKKIYERFGFELCGIDPKNDNLIMRRKVRGALR